MHDLRTINGRQNIPMKEIYTETEREDKQKERERESDRPRCPAKMNVAHQQSWVFALMAPEQKMSSAVKRNFGSRERSPMSSLGHREESITTSVTRVRFRCALVNSGNSMEKKK